MEARATVLSVLIQNEDWDAVESRLVTHPSEASTRAVMITSGSPASCLPLHAIMHRRPPASTVRALSAASPASCAATDACGHGELPLHVACAQAASVGAVRSLLEAYPAGAAAETSCGALPLHRACYCACPSAEVVEALLTAYPEAAGRRIPAAELPLHCACSVDVTPEILDLLLEAHPMSVQATKLGGDLPLHVACHRGVSVRSVERLLGAFPAAIRRRNKQGNLPLHCAVEKLASVEVLAALLRRHPDAAAARNNLGRSPLDLLYRAAKRTPGPLPEAERENHAKTALLLRAARGESVLDVPGEDWPVLHASLDVGKACPLPIVYFLLQRHPRHARRTDRRRRLPLHLAAASPRCDRRDCQVKILRDLVRLFPQGAGMPDGEGRYPLNLAIENCVEWKGLRHLFKAAPYIIGRRDVKTGLTAPLLAASCGAPLSTIYALLRLDPSSVEGGTHGATTP